MMLAFDHSPQKSILGLFLRHKKQNNVPVTKQSEGMLERQIDKQLGGTPSQQTTTKLLCLFTRFPRGWPYVVDTW